MYKIRKTEFGACDEYMIINDTTKESAAITSLGANVRNLNLRAGAQKRPMPVVLGYDTPAELREGSWSRGIKMIPFPNRILDGRYEFGGRQYELPINFPSQHHAIHGLLSKEVLSCRELREKEDSASVMLDFDFKDRFKGYPFDLRVSITHTLSETGFSVRTCAENAGNGPLPFGDGWHPYFRFGRISDVDNWKLKIPAEARVGMDDRLIPTGDLIPVAGTDFDFRECRRTGGLVLDNVFTQLRPSGGIVQTELTNEEIGATIRVWQDSSYGYLVIFTPPGDNRNCIAIEPMTCNTNAFNNRDGLIVLQPGEVFEGEYGVAVE